MGVAKGVTKMKKVSKKVKAKVVKLGKKVIKMRKKFAKKFLKLKPKMIKYCEVKKAAFHMKARCRSYRRFCRIYKKYGLMRAAKRHCNKMKKIHSQMAKKAKKSKKT